VDEVEQLIQLFTSRADAPAARLDILLDLRRHRDPRIVPFLLQVLRDSDDSGKLRIEVVKQLRTVPLAANERSLVAHAIAQVLVDGGDAALRLQAATALGCFGDVDGIPAALGSVALDTSASLDLRFSALTALEHAEATPEGVSLVRTLTSDETLGRAATALLASWRIAP
jgi:hypothetical protein